MADFAVRAMSLPAITPPAPASIRTAVPSMSSKRLPRSEAWAAPPTRRPSPAQGPRRISVISGVPAVTRMQGSSPMPPSKARPRSTPRPCRQHDARPGRRHDRHLRARLGGQGLRPRHDQAFGIAAGADQDRRAGRRAGHGLGDTGGVAAARRVDQPGELGALLIPGPAEPAAGRRAGQQKQREQQPGDAPDAAAARRRLSLRRHPEPGDLRALGQGQPLGLRHLVGGRQIDLRRVAQHGAQLRQARRLRPRRRRGIVQLIAPFPGAARPRFGRRRQGPVKHPQEGARKALVAGRDSRKRIGLAGMFAQRPPDDQPIGHRGEAVEVAPGPLAPGLTALRRGEPRRRRRPAVALAAAGERHRCTQVEQQRRAVGPQ